jgi:tRNA nucleotidyltransferase (CCA-adding enzyme)
MDSWLIALIILALNFLLFIPPLFLFMPKKVFKYKIEDLVKILLKYKLYIFILICVFIFQSIEVNFIDKPLTGWLAQFIGKDGFAPVFHSIEGDWAKPIANHWWKPLLYYFIFFYLIVYTFVLWFIPSLFLLADKEWHTKFALLFYPVMWVIQLPFLLFFPVTNVYKYFGLQSALELIIPGVETSYYSITSINNCFPSLHIGFAVAVTVITFFSDNKRLKWIIPIFSLSVILATIYLAIHWLIDVIGGIALALIVGWLLWTKLNPEAIALSRIKPRRREANKLKRAVNLLKEKTKLLIDGKDIEIQLVGSVAKDTYLKNAIDIDLFLLFPTSTAWKVLESEGILIGKKVLDRWELKYAEHPYIHGKIEGYGVDVVPCYKVKSASEILSAVDRTPFHTQYVKQNLKPRQRNQVRLLKQFLRGIGIYGAGAEVNGFSGYLCELLIIKYGSFRKVLEHAPKWKKEKALTLTKELRPEFDSPLVFIDPVDPNRNVAAAVTERSLEVLKKASKAYLSNPSIRFFFPSEPKQLSIEEIKSRVGEKERLIGLETEIPTIPPEILYSQLKKADRNLRNLLEQNGFNCKYSLYALVDHRILFLFELESISLTEPLLHQGPLAKDKLDSKKFKQKWVGNQRTLKGPYLKGGRWIVEIKREFPNAFDLLNKKIAEVSVGKDLETKVRRGYKLLKQADLLQECYRKYISKLIVAKLPWEYE